MRRLECANQLCQPDGCEQRCEGECCPYAVEHAHVDFRRAVRRGRAVGPLTYFDGLWATDAEGWNPWNAQCPVCLEQPDWGCPAFPASEAPEGAYISGCLGDYGISSAHPPKRMVRAREQAIVHPAAGELANGILQRAGGESVEPVGHATYILKDGVYVECD